MTPHMFEIFKEHMFNEKVDISTMIRQNLMLFIFEVSRWPVFKNENRMYPSNFERKEIENAYGNFKVLFYYNFTKEKNPKMLVRWFSVLNVCKVSLIT